MGTIWVPREPLSYSLYHWEKDEFSSFIGFKLGEARLQFRQRNAERPLDKVQGIRKTNKLPHLPFWLSICPADLAHSTQLIRKDGIPLLHVFGLSFCCVDASKPAPSPPLPSPLPVGYLRGLELRDCLLNVPYFTYRSIRWSAPFHLFIEVTGINP